MYKQLLHKLKESFTSIIPITLIVLILYFTNVVKLEKNELLLFIISSVLAIIGLAIFTLGSDISMTPMGNHIGEGILKTKNLILAIIIVLVLGIFITIAEPDLTVLANQVPIDSSILKIVVAIGVGFFLVVALLRIIFNINLSILLIIFYSILFILLLFTNSDFIPVAFDSGGVTTGPITVPFIMALGIGISGISKHSSSKENSFGLVALCSIGPIISVLILGIFIKDDPIYTQTIIDSSNITSLIGTQIVHYAFEVLLALLPIIIFFFLFQIFFLKLPLKRLYKIFIGLIYTYIGLVIFLTAINMGFMQVGEKIGSSIGSSNYSFLLIPLGLIIGFFVVLAEPAVHVLNKQVEEVTGGNISKRSMCLGLAIGISLSIGLSMLRIIIGFNVLWYLIPGYFISIILSLFVPKIYTAIAFDSGGVASGPMSAGFILPLSIGACGSLQGVDNIMNGAFGIIAMVAMTPLLTIQLLGFNSVMKIKIRQRIEAKRIISENENQIIHFK